MRCLNATGNIGDGKKTRRMEHHFIPAPAQPVFEEGGVDATIRGCGSSQRGVDSEGPIRLYLRISANCITVLFDPSLLARMFHGLNNTFILFDL